jgi:antitoxin CptB
MREVDLVLGRFADAELARMDREQIADLEHLMEAPDPDLLAWVTGERAPPAEFDTPMLRRIAAFHREPQ